MALKCVVSSARSPLGRTVRDHGVIKGVIMAARIKGKRVTVRRKIISRPWLWL